MISVNKQSYDSNKIKEIERHKNEIDFNKLNFKHIVRIKNNKLDYEEKQKSQEDKQKEFHQALENITSLEELKEALKKIL